MLLFGSSCRALCCLRGKANGWKFIILGWDMYLKYKNACLKDNSNLNLAESFVKELEIFMVLF